MLGCSPAVEHHIDASEVRQELAQLVPPTQTQLLSQFQEACMEKLTSKRFCNRQRTGFTTALGRDVADENGMASGAVSFTCLAMICRGAPRNY